MVGSIAIIGTMIGFAIAMAVHIWLHRRTTERVVRWVEDRVGPAVDLLDGPGRRLMALQKAQMLEQINHVADEDLEHLPTPEEARDILESNPRPGQFGHPEGPDPSEAARTGAEKQKRAEAEELVKESQIMAQLPERFRPVAVWLKENRPDWWETVKDYPELAQQLVGNAAGMIPDQPGTGGRGGTV